MTPGWKRYEFWCEEKEDQLAPAGSVVRFVG